ncbi:hypothetical protein GCM10017783_06470 [Deinococcus piscis]|uniref:S-adenosylmethionine-dependent methyltransferase domain-containing protein n=1 Tax=Deinococcus piscis TaxID=394230 RepID=A0ABQ3K0I9_9DEIO|nr:class I SAM-dependent methyltransferase [Deinococcus piscis]GHF97333.1 hypothetical protein GCM10017783_06470 [Deinococcus piscis]
MTSPHTDWAARLHRAAAVRAGVAAQDTTFYRLLHTTETGGLCSLDRIGAVGVLSLYRELSAAQEAALLEAVRPPLDALRLETLYLKRRPEVASHRANTERDWLAPQEPVWGQPVPQLTATERGVPFLFRPGGDLSVGLFADARPMREWVQAHAAGLRVLNTFAYTCGFGLSAALGGALSVKNVDLSRRVLAWGQENYALSGLDAPDGDFLYGDVFDWLRRLHRRGDRFDLLILDPPSFARRGRQTWRAEKDYAALAQAAAALLAPGGQLLAMTNHAGLSERAFGRQVAQGVEGAGRRTAGPVKPLGPGADFPGATHLKAGVWRLA